jgi:uncharacterized protein (DUF924 family)
MLRQQHEEVLHFWFEACKPYQWFRRSDRFDAELSQRFGGLTRAALMGELNHWQGRSDSALALVVLLDQFCRNIWRDQAKAFAGDQAALQLSRIGLQRGWITSEAARAKRHFWLMPMLHSECINTVGEAIPLLERWVDPQTAQIARRNQAALHTYGRYPWRDKALGRC